MEYKATVNGDKSLEIKLGKDNNLTIEGKEISPDIVDLGKGKYHIIYNNKSVSVEVTSIDRVTKTVGVKMNGNSYTVALSTKMDVLLKSMGIDVVDTSASKEIKAPMPGVVIDVLVTEGAEVKKGDQLLILEAMKMENVLKSPSDGVVQSVAIAKGQTVAKNELLVKFQ